jgi:hypothetical protein
MKLWHVSSERGFFFVKATTPQLAKSAGINEWGQGVVVRVRLATKDEARGK